MKKIIILLFLIFLSAPVFAKGVYNPIAKWDTTPIDVYYTKLYNEYMDKVDKGEIDCNNSTFTQYVIYPTSVFADELREQHKED